MKKIAEPVLKYKIMNEDNPKKIDKKIYYGDNENQTHSEQSFNAKGGRDYSNFQLGLSYNDLNNKRTPLTEGEEQILRMAKLKSGNTPLENNEKPKAIDYVNGVFFNNPVDARRKEYEENIPSGDIENTPPIFPTLVQGGFVTFDPFTARQEKTKHLVTGIGPLAKKINFKDIYRNTQSKKESPEPFVYDGEKTEHKDPNWDTHGDAPRDIIKSQQAYLKAMNS